MRKIVAVFFAFAAAALAQPAAAAIRWSLEFEGSYWAYDNADGYSLVKTSAILTTDDETSYDWSYEGYRIRSIEGTRDGVAIIGMETESRSGYDGPLGWPNYPFLKTSWFDHFGDLGFAFQTADGTWYNINSFGDLNENNGSERQTNPLDPNGPFIVQVGRIDIRRLDVAVPVPEPASWALMILGTGTVGATMRRRRPLVAAA